MNKFHFFGVCVVLVLATTAVYWQVGGFEFIPAFDDDLYVINNDFVKVGLTKVGFICNWHPLTMLSHMLDCEFYGLNAGGHHVTSVLFHIANTLLLLFVLKYMTDKFWPSAFVAAAFALHPMHVESVAWISSRKDVLSMFFWLLTILAYVRYTRRPGFTRYLLVFLAFAFGLTSKSVLITLPFVLLLLDYWPLGRFKNSGDIKRLIYEKIPLFALTIAMSFVTVFVERGFGTIQSITKYPMNLRAGNAVVSYMNYIVKMFCPTNLSIFYPHPRQALPVWQITIAILLLIFITVVVLYVLRRNRYLTVGWLWFIGTLVPMIGLVQIGNQAIADRYSYIPFTGLFIMIAWGVPQLLEKWQYRKVVLGISAVMAISFLTASSWIQTSYWYDGRTVFTHALEATDNSYVVQFLMARTLYIEGKTDESISQYKRALEISPNQPNERINMATVLVEKGRFDEAAEEYKKAIDLVPKSAVAHNNLANVLWVQKKPDEAISHYRKALQIKPNYAKAHSNLGRVLQSQGQFDLAIEQYRQSLQISPNQPVVYNNLGSVILNMGGEPALAAVQFREALLLSPNYNSARINLATVLVIQGEFDEAIEHYKQALRIDSSDSRARRGLKEAMVKRNKARK